jgi:uncharacterized protein (DUF427 family)
MTVDRSDGAVVIGRNAVAALLEWIKRLDLRRSVMSGRPVLEPTAEHPITVAPTGRHVTVQVNGTVIAETDDALTLRESDYPAVQYIPMRDVAEPSLVCSDTTTYCPYKGDATYYHVNVAGQTVEDVIWTYGQPYPAVGAIAGHVAFYPDKADITVG